ncbi:acyl transferase/acyl hydrolase/lysophospholipase [Hypoxylon trugodes]|uniref:acyl transferase/acyl hydrolase/lysophospholipase n=1 Tax=Hypoxylon trugodes TaxID=326681 RepID=UPI00219043B5|nr:acyl transferase/acyl hydrolase/lysophospholipase [Hypoxylon trugodes]KAI1389529.1 acyl transferase/acyl hydrolase/lysophospholipase [Hypoxylon trugodes]
MTASIERHWLPGPISTKTDLCLLSLDGGGVRGISSLLILKRLMEGIDRENPPKPCDYFDMICGTSTGGLIALMLGRMRLIVDQCITAYKELSPKIFTKIHHRINLLNGETQGRFDHTALENGVRELLKAYDMEAESLLKGPDEENSCKVFVCATSQQTGRTAILSSYYNERRGAEFLDKATIWQAARATSAATTFFDPITIDDETFVDGATGANNPTNLLWSEAGDIWGHGSGLGLANVRCLVSIGTGVPALTSFGPDLPGLKSALQAIATDTEQTANSFQRDHTELFQKGKAF